MVEREISKKSLKVKPDWTLREFYRMSKRTKPPMPPKVGTKVGSWTVIGAWTNSKGYLQSLKCQCDCGRVEEYINPSNIKVGNTQQCKSCGQKNRKLDKGADWSKANFPSNMNEIHKKRLKDILGGMIARCSQQHHIDTNIKVHESWISNPNTFISHMLTLDDWSVNDLIPDREDTFKGYEPGNVRFITHKDNARNRTDTVFVKYKGESIDVMSFAQQMFGLSRVSDNRKLYNAIHARASKGIDGELIIKYVKMKRLI